MEALTASIKSGVAWRDPRLVRFVSETQMFEHCMTQLDAESGGVRKNVTKLLTSLLAATDAHVSCVRAFELLSVALAALTDEFVIVLGDRLPPKVLRVFKDAESSIPAKNAAGNTAVILLKRLGGPNAAGGPLRKLAASFSLSLLPVLLATSASQGPATGLACTVMVQCMELVPSTVHTKLVVIRQRGLSMLWDGSIAHAHLGATMVAATSVLERGGAVGGWKGMIDNAFIALNILARRVCPKVASAQQNKASSISNLAIPDASISGRDACSDYQRAVILVEALFNIGGSHIVCMPLHIAIGHFSRVLSLDAAVLPSPELLEIKEQCLNLFSSYSHLVGSALLLHHSTCMQMLQASFSWARANSNASLAAVVRAYTNYVQNVPVGHAERSIFQLCVSLASIEQNVDVGSLIVCRPGLWAQLSPEIKAPIESRAVIEALNDSNPILSVQLLNGSATVYSPDVPASLQALPISTLGSLALRFRPPASVWPSNSTNMSASSQSTGGAHVGGKKQVPTNVFFEFEAAEPVTKKVRENVEEAAAEVAVDVVPVIVDELIVVETHFQSFQPNLNVNQPTSVIEEDIGDQDENDDEDDNDDDDDDEEEMGGFVIPMIVDDSSNSNSSDE